MQLKDKVLFIEGVDTCGKSSLGLALAQHYSMDFVDNEPFRESFTSFASADWTMVVAGINLQQAQFARSAKGFIKTRYSLTERVYAEYYSRISHMQAGTMEMAAMGKAVILLVDIDFEKYLELWFQFRQHETVLTTREFNYQCALFDIAYRQCILPKCRVINEGTLQQLVNRSIERIDDLIK